MTINTSETYPSQQRVSYSARWFKQERERSQQRADDIVFYLSVGLVVGLAVGLAVASAFTPVVLTLIPTKAAVGVLTSGITPAKLKVTSTLLCGVFGMLFGGFMVKQQPCKTRASTQSQRCF